MSLRKKKKESMAMLPRRSDGVVFTHGQTTMHRRGLYILRNNGITTLERLDFRALK